MDEYWFEVVASNVQPEARVVLVGNKKDLERQVTTDQGKKLAEKNECLFFETSALTQESVLEVTNPGP